MTFAPGGAAALEAMQSEPFDVVITDMQMPVMDGAALLREVHEQYPQTALLVLSGYADARRNHERHRLGAADPDEAMRTPGLDRGD